jgi:hypothetical protein
LVRILRVQLWEWYVSAERLTALRDRDCGLAGWERAAWAALIHEVLAALVPAADGHMPNGGVDSEPEALAAEVLGMKSDGTLAAAVAVLSGGCRR